MVKLINTRKKYAGTIIVIILVLLFIAFLYKLFIGSLTIRTNSADYCNFEGFPGYSNLEVFPSNPTEISEVADYYYFCMDTFMDPTCKVFMECSFDNVEQFQAECNRLSQISVDNNTEKNEIQYSETLFKYPAYIAMYDWSSCYEYALILEEQKKIVYVFLQGQTQKVDKSYMPLSNNIGNGFSIYSFDDVFHLKYR